MKKKNYFALGSLLSLTLSARPAFAADGVKDIETLIGRLNDLLNIITPFLIGLAVFVIIFGIFRYIVHSANEEKRKEGAQFILWGVIGVFLMISVWGIIAFLTGTFQFKGTIDEGDIPKIPKFNKDGSYSSPN